MKDSERDREDSEKDRRLSEREMTRREIERTRREKKRTRREMGLGERGFTLEASGCSEGVGPPLDPVRPGFPLNPAFLLTDPA